MSVRRDIDFISIRPASASPAIVHRKRPAWFEVPFSAGLGPQSHVIRSGGHLLRGVH